MKEISEAIHLITDAIILSTRQLRNEESSPGADPDRSDDTLEYLKQRITALREMREVLEALR